ncbi:MAG: hypothetical protein HQL62_10790, partial [Magnetococcales bacterium]|nr:hypothetical protein [Magnetococcales bacterium]
LMRDFNDRPNAFGDTVNMASRAMNAADKGQILLNQGYINQFLGEDIAYSVEAPLPYQVGGTPAQLTLESGTKVSINVKHGVFISVRPARLLVNGTPFRHHQDTSIPVSAYQMVVSQTPQGKPMDAKDAGGKSFPDRLRQAHAIAFIQLTGYRLIEQLENGVVPFSDNLQKLWVLMPHADQTTCFQGKEAQIRLEDLPRYISRWKTWLSLWKTDHPRCDVRLKLFKHPPYFGASLIDWEQMGGFIHVSPYVWGKEARECPGYDLEWGGSRSSPAYRAYIDGLTELIGPQESCEPL